MTNHERILLEEELADLELLFEMKSCSIKELMRRKEIIKLLAEED